MATMYSTTRPLMLNNVLRLTLMQLRFGTTGCDRRSQVIFRLTDLRPTVTISVRILGAALAGEANALAGLLLFLQPFSAFVAD